MAHLTLGGRRLEFTLRPPAHAGAPTIVFLHEGLGSLELWRTFPHALATRTGCGMLVYSRWGYGRSASRSTRWSPSFMHDEALKTLPAVMAHFDLNRPILYGHSDGGSIALIAAARRPSVIRAVITEAAHVIVEHVSVEGVRRLRARYDSGDLRQRLERYHGPNTQALFDGWTETWLGSDFRTWDLRPLLPLVHCPVLAMQGDADEFGTGAQVDAMACGVAGPVETWILSDCGHTPHREHRRAVLERSTAFIAGVTDGRGLFRMESSHRT